MRGDAWECAWGIGERWTIHGMDNRKRGIESA